MLIVLESARPVENAWPLKGVQLPADDGQRHSAREPTPALLTQTDTSNSLKSHQNSQYASYWIIIPN